jgi:hypothetical protein
MRNTKMSESLVNQFFKKQNNPTKKILLTLFILYCSDLEIQFLYPNRSRSFKKIILQLETRNSIMQIINMYSGGWNNIIESILLVLSHSLTLQS